MIRQWELRGYGQWSVVEKASDEVAGWSGVRRARFGGGPPADPKAL